MGGSTDFGNVSQVLPAAMYMIKTHPSGLPWHSTEVAEGSGQAMALDGMMMGACALAGVAIDLLSAPALLEQARQDFEHVR
jgi:metal-dependent amidase/aminoacylase/carboxypeptidase family protein